MRAPQLLFVCAQDGARSRMAEAFTRQAAGDRIGVRSATFGWELTSPLPSVVMAEAGIALPGDPPVWVFEIFKRNGQFDHVITLTDPSGFEGASIFLAAMDDLCADTARRHDWVVKNFNLLPGREEERLAQARLIRDDIRAKTLDFLTQIGITPAGA